MNTPKRRILSLVFTVLCFKKSLLIRTFSKCIKTASTELKAARRFWSLVQTVLLITNHMYLFNWSCLQISVWVRLWLMLYLVAYIWGIIPSDNNKKKAQGLVYICSHVCNRYTFSCRLINVMRVLNTYLRRGWDLIISSATTNVTRVPGVSLRIVAWKSPLTSRLSCRAYNFTLLGWRTGLTLDLCTNALNWCSSILLKSAPLSAACLHIHIIQISFNTPASSTQSSYLPNFSRLRLVLCCLCKEFIIRIWRFCRFYRLLYPSFDFTFPGFCLLLLWDLHTTAKWFHLWHLLLFFPSTGNLFLSPSHQVIHKSHISMVSSDVEIHLSPERTAGYQHDRSVPFPYLAFSARYLRSRLLH